MKNNKGFTLIELLVVVLIIGILAAIALPQYFRAVERSRAAEANSVLGAVNHAQAVYRMANPTEYASQFDQLDTEFVGSDGNVAGSTSVLTTKLFQYTITGGATNTANIKAVRQDGIGYVLGIRFVDGAKCCTNGNSTNKNGANICASMGMTSSDGCTFSPTLS